MLDTTLYIQDTNWLATFTKLQYWYTIQELTYLPKVLAGKPRVLLLQLGNAVLGLAIYKYTAETEGVLNYILQYILLV